MNRTARTASRLLPVLLAAAVLSACGGRTGPHAPGAAEAADPHVAEAAAEQPAAEGTDAPDGERVPDPCTLLSGPVLERYFAVPVDPGYDPGFTGGLLDGEERSCTWDTTELFDEGSLTVSLRTAADAVPRATYPEGRTQEVVIDGATEPYAVADTPYRIYFVKGGVSVQALYQPEYEGAAPDDDAEMARFTELVRAEVATRL